jgi:hypothetical protein
MDLVIQLKNKDWLARNQDNVSEWNDMNIVMRRLHLIRRFYNSSLNLIVHVHWVLIDCFVGIDHHHQTFFS